MSADRDRWIADCDGNAGTVATRCEEVIAAVRRGQVGGWPELDDWKRILPGWFTSACVDDREVQNCVLDRWSLRAWLHWLKPENMRWEWVGAEPEGQDRLVVIVGAVQRPYLKGALVWLVKTAGGKELRPS